MGLRHRCGATDGASLRRRSDTAADVEAFAARAGVTVYFFIIRYLTGSLRLSKKIEGAPGILDPPTSDVICDIALDQLRSSYTRLLFSEAVGREELTWSRTSKAY